MKIKLLQPMVSGQKVHPIGKTITVGENKGKFLISVGKAKKSGAKVKEEKPAKETKIDKDTETKETK